MLQNRYFLLLITLVLLFTMQGCAKQTQEVHLTGATMGTTYNVKFVANETINSSEIHSEIDTLLIQVNKQMSTYDPDSELSKFNQWHSTEPFVLSPETLLVMREAKRLGELSGGVLDVTVGPLVNLWGFGPDARPDTVPSDELIKATQARTGLEKLILDQHTAQKILPELYVDLSTIAKGYGVDKVAEVLESHGLQNYLVEIGGEMRVAGTKLNGMQWRIAVEKPVSTERAVETILSIGNNAIATSGDYRNYFEENGVRYSHLIDPRTGFPIQHNLVAVSVVNASSMTADGLATALIVMGKEQALEVAQKNNLDVLLITRENGQFTEYTTGKFDEYVKAANP